MCIGIMFLELIDTTRKDKNSYIKVVPKLKFVCMLGILLTFIVFNFILSGDREMYLNFKVNSVLFHIILPIMYVIDWFLFYERRKVKIITPVLSIIMPLVYIIFIFTRVWLLDYNNKVTYLYPYFFLDLDKLGVIGVVKWCIMLCIGFIVMGYIILGLDKIFKSFKKGR